MSLPRRVAAFCYNSPCFPFMSPSVIIIVFNIWTKVLQTWGWDNWGFAWVFLLFLKCRNNIFQSSVYSFNLICLIKIPKFWACNFMAFLYQFLRLLLVCSPSPALIIFLLLYGRLTFVSVRDVLLYDMWLLVAFILVLSGL